MAICLQERGNNGVLRTFTKTEWRVAKSNKYGFGLMRVIGPRKVEFKPMNDREEGPAVTLSGKAIRRAKISIRPTLPGDSPTDVYCKSS